MAEFEKDAADFKADLERLGIRSLTLEEIAGRIDYSISHVSNLLAGGKRYTPGARTKLGEMIAAKDDGPGEQMITKISELPPIPESELISDATQGAGTVWQRGEQYRIFNATEGFVVVTVVATFIELKHAEQYRDLLNKEAG